MPAVAPPPTVGAKEVFTSLGERIRTHHKALSITVTAAAQAAGLSRVTCIASNKASRR